MNFCYFIFIYFNGFYYFAFKWDFFFFFKIMMKWSPGGQLNIQIIFYPFCGWIRWGYNNLL
jgi:hypothetical protein